MKQMRHSELASAALAEAEVQGGIESQMKDLVRRDPIFTRKGRSLSLETSPGPSANDLVQRISAVSMEVIEQAINQLQSMKTSLLDQNEQVRLQIRAFELANEDASCSLKNVSDILVQWKQNSLVASPLEAAE